MGYANIYKGHLFIYSAVIIRVYLQNKNVYPVMKLFHSDGRGVLVDSAPLHKERGLSEWLDEEDNYVDYMLRPPNSARQSPVEHLGDAKVKCSPSPSPKHQLRECLMEELCFSRLVCLYKNVLRARLIVSIGNFLQVKD